MQAIDDFLTANSTQQAADSSSVDRIATIQGDVAETLLTVIEQLIAESI